MLSLEGGRANTRDENLGKEYGTDKMGMKGRIKENLKGCKAKGVEV
jgi:hypothetical protein